MRPPPLSRHARRRLERLERRFAVLRDTLTPLDPSKWPPAVSGPARRLAAEADQALRPLLAAAGPHALPEPPAAPLDTRLAAQHVLIVAFLHANPLPSPHSDGGPPRAIRWA